MTPWQVKLVVAGHTWVVTDLDPATPGPTAPLTMRQAVPEDDLWPSQPMPKAATFGLVAETAAELADVVEGAVASIIFTAPPNPTEVTFDGNVTDVEVTPARFRPDPASPSVAGVRLTVTAIGYLAQLWEWPVTITEGVGEDGTGTTFALNRYQTMFDNTPWASPVDDPRMVTGFPNSPLAPSIAWNHFPMEGMAPLNVEGEALGPHLENMLRAWLWQQENQSPPAPPERIIIEPVVDPVTRQLGQHNGPFPDSVDSWQARLVGNEVAVTPVADLALTATGWGVVVDPDAGGPVIRASRVEQDIRFVQRKRANTSKVVVPYYDALDSKPHTLSSDNGKRPAVMHTLPGDGGDLPAVAINVNPGQTPNTVIRPIADFYLPQPVSDAWGVDTATWRMDRDTPGRVPPALGSIVIIAGVAETQNPNAKDWVAGLVRAWTLTLPDATVELDLAPANARMAVDPAGTPLTWDEVPAGVTWDQLRPDHTWDDYQLLRGA